MARNFYENGFRLLYPQINWGGNSPGYVESEFPIYSFVIALLYDIFGMSDTWGRLLSVIFSLCTICVLYLLVRKFISENAAVWSSFIYSIIPLSIFYSRAFMPESAMLMCSVAGIWWFSEWLDKGKAWYFILSCVAIAMAVLLKLPALYLGLPLLYLAWVRYGKSVVSRWILWLYAVLVILPVVLWYDHAHRIYEQSGLTYNIWGFGTDKWGNFDIIFTLKFYNDVLFKSIAERHLTWAGFIPFIGGLFIKRSGRRELLFDYWLIAVVIYFLIVGRGNQVHEYYQLPFILPAVVFIGKAFARYLPVTALRDSFASRPLPTSVCLIFVVAVGILSYLRYDNLMGSETLDSPIFRLAAAVDTSTKKDDLIVTVSEGNPIYLYRCDRKGWNADADQVDSAFLAGKKQEGAKYVIGETDLFNSPGRKKKLDWLIHQHTPIFVTRDEFIVAL